MSPAWIALAITGAGVFALAFAAPRAKAAENEPAPAIDREGWSLWACLPDRGPAGCVLMARPMGKTACMLAMNELVAQVPKGTRLACANVEHVTRMKETKR